MTKTIRLYECEELYPLLVREHAEHPVYVLPFEAVADLPRIDAHGWASSGVFMDPNLIDRIPRYRGPGTVIMLDLISIGQVASPGCFERCVRGVFIHELGHRALYPPMEPPSTDRARDISFRAMARQSVSSPPKPFTPSDPHDAWFIRQATHLMFRALVAGVDVTTHRLYGDSFSPFEGYLNVLLPECVNMMDATFADIAATEPPAAFTARWERDRQLFTTTTTTKDNFYVDELIR